MAIEERFARRRRRRRRPEDGDTAARRAERLRAPGVLGVHVGAVPDSAGHHAQAVLPSQDVLGIHHGSCVYRTHVAGLPAGRSRAVFLSTFSTLRTCPFRGLLIAAYRLNTSDHFFCL